MNKITPNILSAEVEKWEFQKGVGGLEFFM